MNNQRETATRAHHTTAQCSGDAAKVRRATRGALCSLALIAAATAFASAGADEPGNVSVAHPRLVASDATTSMDNTAMAAPVTPEAAALAHNGAASGANAQTAATVVTTAPSASSDQIAQPTPPGASIASNTRPSATTSASTIPRLESDKARQLAAEQQIAARIPSASGMNEPRVRPLTLRDSGIGGSMLFARDTDFRVTGDIGFMIHDMAASLVPTHDAAPVVFDDPTSVTIDVHRGSVTLDADKLTAIFNRYLFQYEGSPLRNMRVVPQDGQLRITGEMRRGTWVPIVLVGKLSMKNAGEMVFHADHIEVAGVAADRLMAAANVKMADLLKVNTPIARLDGDDVVMQVAKLTPPPALNMTITAIRTAPDGVSFTLDDGTLATIAWPATMPAHGMMVQGGDVKFMRSMPMNIDMAIVPLDPPQAGKPFVLDLYHYREQMAAGYFTFDQAGALDVHLPSYASMGDAATRTVRDDSLGIGSASARFNDTFLRNQQAALAAARGEWTRVPMHLQMAGAGSGQPATASMPAASGKARAMPVSLRGTLNGNGPRMSEPGTAIGDERHSGGPLPLIHVRNVDFYVSGQIGFHVRSLNAQLVPKHPGQPVDLDDPNQYDIHIIDGEVIEPWPAMAALFNDYLLDYSPRSLNDLKLTPDMAHGTLQVTGGIKLWNHFPGVWLPTTMNGTIEARDERHLVYTPDSVKVLGVSQAGLLRALNIPLASLTPFKRKGVALEGNQLVFDQYTVFPPPMLQGRLASATVTDDGLVLRFRAQPGMPVARAPADAGRSFVFIQSGDIKMFNALVVNGRTLIRDTKRDGPMHFDLYGYRRDVARGTVRMGQDGGLSVDLAARR